jgi:hypothetical protein
MARGITLGVNRSRFALTFAVAADDAACCGVNLAFAGLGLIFPLLFLQAFPKMAKRHYFGGEPEPICIDVRGGGG